MPKFAPRIRLLGSWLAVLLSAAGCVDPKCPSGYDEKGDTCYRRKDAGVDGATMEVPDDDEPIEDGSSPALEPDADATEMDGGTDPDIDAMGETLQQKDASASVEPDPGLQPRPEDDASSPVDPCKPNPCQNGGICSSEASTFTCVCAEGHTGTNCELKVCGPTMVQSRADVENSQLCAEIRGDLSINTTLIANITADDFPRLAKITGSLFLVGFPVGNGAHLESVTLVALRRIDGGIAVLGTVGNAGAAVGPLSELHLPALTSVGTGLAVKIAALKVLDLPSLVSVGGYFELSGIDRLCEVDFGKVQRIDGDLNLYLVPKLSSKQLEPLRAATTGAVTRSLLGCCWPNSGDRVSCEDFSSEQWSMYCTGC